MIDSSKILYVKLIQNLPGVEVITFEILNVFSHFETIFDKRPERSVHEELCNRELQLYDIFRGLIKFHFTSNYLSGCSGEVKSYIEYKEVLFSRKLIEDY